MLQDKKRMLPCIRLRLRLHFILNTFLQLEKVKIGMRIYIFGGLVGPVITASIVPLCLPEGGGEAVVGCVFGVFMGLQGSGLRRLGVHSRSHLEISH